MVTRPSEQNLAVGVVPPVVEDAPVVKMRGGRGGRGGVLREREAKGRKIPVIVLDGLVNG